ncbi:hypothetical protein [Micromonospora sp. NPDC049282]|uniref:hypothetical protein n=1 Tax=Micromonospora sp. NPDC049282 TaxID=3364269 RepID=UPI003714B671
MLNDTPPGLTAGRRDAVQAVTVVDPVRVRRLSDQEGQQLLRITRRGTGSPIRLRRAMVVLASAGGNTGPAIARLVQANEDTIRQVSTLAALNRRLEPPQPPCADPPPAPLPALGNADARHPGSLTPTPQTFMVTAPAA